MKILLTSNKTYRNTPDAGYWYTYTPLQELGHEVFWYDTVNPEEKDYNKIIESFKPDLIFCCVTGDSNITPYEPWESIQRETESGRTTTFNWFCDDTWRFKGFSSISCQHFHICSTPEPTYVSKYQESGYKNIILATWHANSVYYNNCAWKDKSVPISFIGAPNPHRQRFFNMTKDEVSVANIFGVTQEQLFDVYCQSQIGLNLSFNANDPEFKTQMKQRVFEIVAGAGTLLTQDHDGLEQFFVKDNKPNPEIVTFKTIEEFIAKAQFLLKHPSVVKKIAERGHKRFLAEHDSKIRLKKTLEQIKTLS